MIYVSRPDYVELRPSVMCGAALHLVPRRNYLSLL